MSVEANAVLERCEIQQQAVPKHGITVEDSSGDILFWAVAVDKNKNKNRLGFIFDWDSPADIVVDAFKANPTLLWRHEDFDVPIGRVEEIQVDNKRVKMLCRIPSYQENPEMAAFEGLVGTLRQLIIDGFLRAVSIGFYILREEARAADADKPEYERARIIKQIEIVELSVCSIGAHESALIQQYAKIAADAPNPVAVPPACTWANEAADGKMLYRLSLPDPAAAQETATTYQCECIECGYQMESEEHCKDNKCPECGGTMRRAERPGPGEPSAALPAADQDASPAPTPTAPANPASAEKVYVGTAVDAVIGTLDAFDTHPERQDDTWRAIPYSRHGDGGVRAEDTPWDGPAETKAADVDKLKIMCTLENKEALEAKGGYKLPHHTATGNKAVWNGVRAAMGVVLGARGGVKGAGVEVRKSAHAHLKKHYAQFDKDAPDFKQDYTADELNVMHVIGAIVVPGHSPAELPADPKDQVLRSIEMTILETFAGMTAKIIEAIRPHVTSQAEVPDSPDGDAPDDGSGRPQETDNTVPAGSPAPVGGVSSEVVAALVREVLISDPTLVQQRADHVQLAILQLGRENNARQAANRRRG